MALLVLCSNIVSILHCFQDVTTFTASVSMTVWSSWALIWHQLKCGHVQFPIHVEHVLANLSYATFYGCKQFRWSLRSLKWTSLILESLDRPHNDFPIVLHCKYASFIPNYHKWVKWPWDATLVDNLLCVGFIVVVTVNSYTKFQMQMPGFIRSKGDGGSKYRDHAYLEVFVIHRLIHDQQVY